MSQSLYKKLLERDARIKLATHILERGGVSIVVNGKETRDKATLRFPLPPTEGDSIRIGQYLAVFKKVDVDNDGDIALPHVS